MKKFLLTILSFLLIVSVMIGIFVIPMETVLFNKSFYLNIFQEEDFYSNLHLLFIQTMAERTELFGQYFDFQADSVINELNEDQLNRLFSLIFTSDWVEIQSIIAVNQIFNFMNFETEVLSIIINFVEPKANIESETVRVIINDMINNLPSCTFEDLLRFGTQPGQDGNLQIPFCKPPQELIPILGNFIQGILVRVVQQLPNEIDLVNILNLKNQFNQDRSWFLVYQWSRLGFFISALISIPLIFSIVLLTWGEWKSTFSYLGSTFTVAGIIGLILVFVGYVSRMLVLDSIINRYFSDEILNTFDIFQNIGIIVIDRFNLVAFVCGVIVTCTGMICLLLKNRVKQTWYH